MSEGDRWATGEVHEGIPAVRSASLEDWRAWLKTYGEESSSVWLIVYGRDSGTPSVTFHDALEHALCFGWVDSKAVRRDPDSVYLRFSRRNPRSTWGKKNRERVERLTRDGFMQPQGQRVIDAAKTSGTWDRLEEAQNEVVPPDLEDRFEQDHRARGNFRQFPPSSKRLILEWIASAQRPETRQRRIMRTVSDTHDNIRSNHPKTKHR